MESFDLVPRDLYTLALEERDAARQAAADLRRDYERHSENLRSSISSLSERLELKEVEIEILEARLRLGQTAALAARSMVEEIHTLAVEEGCAHSDWWALSWMGKKEHVQFVRRPSLGTPKNFRIAGCSGCGVVWRYGEVVVRPEAEGR